VGRCRCNATVVIAGQSAAAAAATAGSVGARGAVAGCGKVEHLVYNDHCARVARKACSWRPPVWLVGFRLGKGAVAAAAAAGGGGATAVAATATATAAAWAAADVDIVGEFDADIADAAVTGGAVALGELLPVLAVAPAPDGEVAAVV